ncbi:MAG TPA: RidA family protein [Allosphingosinicella sp.]|jgi:reactive intermediate/imine deaminase
MRTALLAAAAAIGPATGASAAERPAVEYYAPDEAAQAAARAGGFRLPFSSAVRVGDVLYLSGVIGTRDDGALPPGIEAQARQTMDNIGAMLKRAGRSFDDLFKCTVMIDDMKQWQAFNQVYTTYFKPDRLPARSALGADGLALGALVEVECLAHAPAR